MFYFFLKITPCWEDKKLRNVALFELFVKRKNHMGQHKRFWYLSHTHKSLFQRHMLTYPTGIVFLFWHEPSSTSTLRVCKQRRL